MDKQVLKYAKIYRSELDKMGFDDIDRKTSKYSERLEEMFSSDIYREHNIYPTMNTELIYSVIAMCLELKEYGLSDREIIDFYNDAAKKRRKMILSVIKMINVLPNSYNLVRKWNVNDHDKRVKDGSITYDVFEITDGRIEYRISKCMYVEMFRYYGIQGLCKIFCMTDEMVYSHIPKNVRFVRYSDLSDGDCCHDEIFDRSKEKNK